MSSFSTTSPSSVMAIAPEATISLMGAICTPCRPKVAHAVGKTRHLPSCSAVLIASCTISSESIGGVVLGIVQTVVNPPLLAEAIPVLVFSSCLPLLGSRKCTCISISPGETIQPSQSMMSQSFWLIGESLNSATTPSRISRSPMKSWPLFIILPF